MLDYFEVSCMSCPCGIVVESLGMEGTMTQSEENRRARLPDKDRREVAKRIFDALCVKYPEKYIALVQPGEPVAPTPSEA